MKRLLGIFAGLAVTLLLVTASAHAMTITGNAADGFATADSMSMPECGSCLAGDDDGPTPACNIDCTIPVQGVIADAAQPIAIGRIWHFAAPSVWLVGATTPPEPHPPRQPFLN